MESVSGLLLLLSKSRVFVCVVYCLDQVLQKITCKVHKHRGLEDRRDEISSVNAITAP